MSKQLSVASAFSVFALSAMALFAPQLVTTGDGDQGSRATIELTAPAFLAELPLND